MPDNKTPFLNIQLTKFLPSIRQITPLLPLPSQVILEIFRHLPLLSPRPQQLFPPTLKKRFQLAPPDICYEHLSFLSYAIHALMFMPLN